MTQPTERRFVMEPRLDAEVETLNLAIDAEETARIAGDALKVAKAGDTMTGALTLNADPTNNLHAATKQYVDNVTINTDNLGDIDYIQFDTTYAGGSTAAGMLAWDQANETLQFMLDDHVTLQIGQEHVIRVKNNSGSVAIPERTVVMFAGATGDTIKVTPAVSDGSVNVNYLAGITTEEIPADGFGFITQLGFINQVNTNAWPVGTLLYVDPATPGGLTATEPESPAWIMPVAAVTKQNASAGRILVRSIPGGSGAGGGASVNISDTVPAGGNAGDLWYDSTDGTLYVYYEDVDGSQWVQVQANSALTAGIESRVGALESQAIAFGAVSPNFLINGSMDVWQRGTSFTSSGYTADRWTATVSGTCTHSQETSDVPAGSRYAYKWTTGASSSFGQIRQFIETSNVAQLRGKTVTASAYVKLSANFTGTLVLEVQYSTTTDTNSGFSGTAPSQVTTGTPNSSGYTRITSTFTVPSNAVGLYVGIVPTLAQVSGAVALMGNIQLEVGSVATAFRRNQNTYEAELAACKRYCWVAGPPNIIAGIAYATTAAYFSLAFPTEMRATPAYSGNAGSITISDNYAANYSATSSAVGGDLQIDSRGIRFALNGFTGLTVSRPYFGLPITSYASTFKFTFSAEL